MTQTSDDGETALHKAAQEGHVAVATALIFGGCDIAAKDSSGNTPIHGGAVQADPSLKAPGFKLVL